MADNPNLPANTGKAAAREISYSGDTAFAALVGIGLFTGADDAKVATDVSATAPFPMYGPNATAGPTAFSASDAVVGAPDGLGTPVSGASTAGSIVSIAVTAGSEAWTLALSSYGTGTIYTEGSIDSTNGTDGTWVALKGRRTGTAVGVESVVYSVVANGYYRGNCAGMTYLRARLIGTGTPSVRFLLSAGSGATFLNSGIPSGTSDIGKVNSSVVAASGTITTQNLVPAGTATAGSAVEITLGGSNTLAVQTTGTYTGALSLQVTINGTTWVTVGGTPIIDLNTGGYLASITSALQSVFQAEAGGFLKARITALAAVTGTATLTLQSVMSAALVSLDTSLPAGTAVIGALSANQSTNIAQMNGVATTMGNGVAGTGVQRVTIASDNTAIATAGQGAIAAAAPAGATMPGLKAATANPANATNANLVAAMGDKAGRTVNTPVQVRELITVGTLSIAATAETTLIAAGGAGVFNDITQLIITTAGAAAQTITLKDATAGTSRAVFNYPNAALAPSAPLVINFNPPIPQAAANANWTITQSVATACNYTFVYAKNL